MFQWRKSQDLRRRERLQHVKIHLPVRIKAMNFMQISAKRFDYSDALTGDNLKSLVIKLPALQNNDGSFFVDAEKKYSDEGFTPDWIFMNEYMETIELKSQERINIIKSIVG